MGVTECTESVNGEAGVRDHYGGRLRGPARPLKPNIPTLAFLLVRTGEVNMKPSTPFATGGGGVVFPARASSIISSLVGVTSPRDAMTSPRDAIPTIPPPPPVIVAERTARLSAAIGDLAPAMDAFDPRRCLPTCCSGEATIAEPGVAVAGLDVAVLITPIARRWLMALLLLALRRLAAREDDVVLVMLKLDADCHWCSVLVSWFRRC